MGIARQGDLISYVHPIIGSPYTQEIPIGVCSLNVFVNGKPTVKTPFLFTVEDEITGSGTLTFTCAVTRNTKINEGSKALTGDIVTVTHSSGGSTVTGEIITGSLDVN